MKHAGSPCLFSFQVCAVNSVQWEQWSSAVWVCLQIGAHLENVQCEREVYQTKNVKVCFWTFLVWIYPETEDKLKPDFYQLKAAVQNFSKKIKKREKKLPFFYALPKNITTYGQYNMTLLSVLLLPSEETHLMTKNEQSEKGGGSYRHQSISRTHC